MSPEEWKKKAQEDRRAESSTTPEQRAEDRLHGRRSRRFWGRSSAAGGDWGDFVGDLIGDLIEGLFKLFD